MMRGLVHADEPLLGGAEDHGIVTAPAMRVAVLVFVITKKRAAIFQKLHNDGIRGENVLPFVFGQAFEINTTVVNGCVDLQPIFLAGIKVVGAVSWSSVDDTGALIQSDVTRKNAGNLNRQKRMLKFHAVKIAALKHCNNTSFLNVAIGLQGSDTISGKKQLALFSFDNDVIEIGMKSERTVMRNGPRCSGPNDSTNVASKLGSFATSATNNSKLHPDRRANVIFVFNFSLSQRSAVVDAPINRFPPAINVTFLHEIKKRAGDGGFVSKIHREIRIIPLTKNPQPLEILFVLLDIARCELPTELTKFCSGNFAFPTKLFFNLRLNGQPMT